MTIPLKNRIYHEWLGIPLHVQPPLPQAPNHYLLLGIPQLESNVETIRNAFEQRRGIVKKLTRGEFETVGEEVLAELEAARLCLLTPASKAAYDAGLLPSNSSSSHASRPPREWLVGAHSTCDLVIAGPTVSRTHCRIIFDGVQLKIVDISRNGTYINQRRLERNVPTPVKWLDLVTLGLEHRLLFPPSISRLLKPRGKVHFLGRSPQNDCVVDDPSVSLFHARLVRSAHDLILEDFHSSNGTWWIDALGKRRAVKRQAVLPSAEIDLGSKRLVVQQLMESW